MSKNIEQTYQKKTQLEHILLRPDTYIGSVDSQSQLMWVIDDKDPNSPKMVQKNITYVPGLFKIFDEIIVNAADNIQRDIKGVTQIKVNIDQEKGTIKVWNNGKGVPVTIHKKENVYVPELIFGHLLTSSNYDDSIKKVTGGRNGFGAKLANVFSKKFEIECADVQHKKLYKQQFKNNMSVIGEPKISDYPSDSYDYTQVMFEPDLKKFGMKQIDKDVYSLFKKRVYDLAGCSPKTVSVYLNGKKIQNVKNFEDYIDLYFSKKNESKKGQSDDDEDQNQVKIYEKVNIRWEICVSISDTGSFQQVSFVNNICTSRGGTHCNYISDQIVKKCSEILQKKNKNLNIKPAQIKNNLFIFINCLIENPAFDSQTKETLTLKKEQYGSVCELSEAFLKKIANCGIIQNIIDFAQAKENIEMKKKLGSQGKKQKKLIGIPKLEDANMAGSSNSRLCTLILTEGDSAKTLAMSGIQIVGRDHYGVFPLKGKLLNVRDATNKQIIENQEIQNLMKIVGLQLGTDYLKSDNFQSLRYGCVMIMTDQDHDGSHIKGLLINFFEHFWPSLLKRPGFLKEFVTPIIKVTKKTGQNASNTFFTIADYKVWEEQILKQSTNKLDQYTIKYYKGLGTSTTNEAKEYFSDLKKHIIQFDYKGDDCKEAIHMAFQKSRADDRKSWLLTYDMNKNVDHNTKKLSYLDFVNYELIHFSIADNMRSIPSVMDGLKPGQRKILFSCFKRKLKNEIKVAQLSGYVAEHSAYHHGEMSLQQTIINMAQDFVGSNNINVLLPNGMFGTRLNGGKEAASARYIFTNLNSLTRIIFPEQDDPLLGQIEEEGMKIEPQYYVPIIPLVLCNGAEGIGTGWMTSIPNFNPLDIVQNIEKRLNNSSYKFQRMRPWFRNFFGSIEPQITSDSSNANSFIVNGVWKKIDKTTIQITELPIKKWTRDYKNMLEDMILEGDLVEEISEFHKDETVDFKIKLKDDVDHVEKMPGGVKKKFKLSTTISANNYVLFDKFGKIKKYEDEVQILEDFYQERFDLYQKRKEHLIRILKKEVAQLQNKQRFIKEITSGNLSIKDQSKQELIKMLIQMKYLTQGQLDQIQSHGEYKEIQFQSASDFSESHNFEYILGMSLWSLTKERIESLESQSKSKNEELQKLQKQEVKDLWLEDLLCFKNSYDQGKGKCQYFGFEKLNLNGSQVKQVQKEIINEKLNDKKETFTENVNDLKDNQNVEKPKTELNAKKNDKSAILNFLKSKAQEQQQESKKDVQPAKKREVKQESKKSKNNKDDIFGSESEEVYVKRESSTRRYKLDENFLNEEEVIQAFKQNKRRKIESESMSDSSESQQIKENSKKVDKKKQQDEKEIVEKEKQKESLQEEKEKKMIQENESNGSLLESLSDKMNQLKSVNTGIKQDAAPSKVHDDLKSEDEEDIYNVNSSVNLKKRRVIINDDSD